jgi:guanylate kinase
MVPGRLIVVSGPSGSGKTTICERLLADARFHRVVTCTTRSPRGREQNGVDYHFLSRDEFERGIAKGRFAEYAEVYGNLYGTPLDEVLEGIESGAQLLLNIDVQGARQLREKSIAGMVSIFIEPPDLAILEARLRRRGTEEESAVRRRIAVAREEWAEKAHYDHAIVNDDIERAVNAVYEALELPRAQ